MTSENQPPPQSPNGGAIVAQANARGVKPNCVSICDPGQLNPSRYMVNQAGAMEMISQPLYDIQSYPAAGATQFTFFQLPVGQGSKTLSDTNMKAAGALPAPVQFMIKAIGINWYPGQTASAPVQLGAAAIAGSLNDMAAVFRAGWLSLDIGNKNYLQMGPLDKFPPRSHLSAAVATSDATTAAGALNLRMEVPYIDGPLFDINPITLFPMQNWSVTLNFPTAVALPSTDALARIGISLWGLMFRSVQ